MRTLKFIVDKQIITQDPKCDFSGLVPGSEGYLKAEFAFSPDWRDTVKGVGFWTRLGKECPPQILEDGKTCIIPAEALKGKEFKLAVMGKKEGFKLVTNKVIVRQDGGKR